MFTFLSHAVMKNVYYHACGTRLEFRIKNLPTRSKRRVSDYFKMSGACSYICERKRYLKGLKGKMYRGSEPNSNIS